MFTTLPNKRAGLLGLLLVLVCGLGAAGEGKLRIGFATSNLDDTFLNYVVSEARKAAADHGATLAVEGAGENTDTQLAQVRAMVDGGVDAVVLVITDTSRSADFVELTKEKKVPLIFVNRNPFPGDRPPPDCYVIATDAFVEGETQMNYAGQIIGPEGKLFILQGLATNDSTKKRCEGVISVVSSTYPEMAVVAEDSANWMRGQARSLVHKWLDSYDEMDAILANNDDMALGALDALSDRRREGVTVLGVDAIPAALEAIAEGRLAGTVLQDPVLQGRGAVEIALRAAKGESQPQNQILPSELVTKENVRNFMK